MDTQNLSVNDLAAVIARNPTTGAGYIHSGTTWSHGLGEYAPFWSCYGGSEADFEGACHALVEIPHGDEVSMYFDGPGGWEETRWKRLPSGYFAQTYYDCQEWQREHDAVEAYEDYDE